MQVEVLSEAVRVSGHACRRGVAYAEAEVKDPRRMITTTVRVRGGVLPLVPVRSREPIPKDRIREALAELREVTLDAPVSMHQLVSSSVAGTGVAVVTTRPVAANGHLPQDKTQIPVVGCRHCS